MTTIAAAATDSSADVETFGLIVLIAAAVVTLAVVSNRLGERLRVPTPLFFLAGAAVASDIVPSLYDVPTTTVQRIVTVALAVILFDGGMHIGWRRFRSAGGAVTLIGIVGTAVTVVGVALLAHGVFDLSWRSALLVGAALAPTDPAVVFSVLGQREITGRAGTILEGESGANDPVGIALMLGILAASGSGGGAIWHGVSAFGLEMVVGLVVGLVGGAALLVFMRRVPLPGAGLYPIRTLAAAMGLYGIAAVAHGSGFLAVFVAGILIGDERAPYKAEISRFTASLASLGEIVAFVVLGLTVHLDILGRDWTWAIGLGLAALLAFVVRPALVGLLTLGLDLRRGEKLFVLWSGLKGAVPILLGTFVVGAVPDGQRLYALIVVVVVFSVLVQGSLVPAVAARCGVEMRTVAPAPFAVGVRLRDEPDHLRRYVVAAGSAADGTALVDLGIEDRTWISMVARDGQLVGLHGDTVLRAGDEVLAIADPEAETDADAGLFDPDSD